MTELFKNSHDALTFAFNYSSQQYAQSPMSKALRGPSAGTGKGLYSLDGAAQAGLIRAQVDKLAPLHRACVIARYSPRFKDCPCCGGPNVLLQEYREVIASLGQWSTVTFSGLSVRTARELIIRSFYERSIKVQAIADGTKVAKRTLHENKAKIWEGLSKLDHAALTEIDKVLRSLTVPVDESDAGQNKNRFAR